MATGDAAGDSATLADLIKALAPRWFVIRNAKRPKQLALLQSRNTLCWLRGPMTRTDLRALSAGLPEQTPSNGDANESATLQAASLGLQQSS